MRSVVVNLNHRLADVQQAAQGVEALRAQRNSLLEETRFLIDKKQARPVVIEIMDELTRILPDSTWLLSLQLNADNLVIQGESPASSELIEIIEASPYFYGTSFRAPVTKNPRSVLEGFQISTQIVSGKEA
jgi:general secretion pathway protein L